MGGKDHPVWRVYDLYRTARLNVKYYSAKLHSAEVTAKWIDWILLVTAPGSAIAGLWFWQEPIGEKIWQVFGVIAAFAAVSKPSLKLSKKIKTYEELRIGYRALEHDLYEITEMVIQEKKYDKKLQTRFLEALTRKGVLVKKEPDSKENKKLKRKCEDEVKRELPPSYFYVPE